MGRKSEKMAEVGAPLSKFGVLVAQLNSIVASARQQAPDPLLCFDLLSDLVSTIEDEPKESILLWQRKCEDALQSLILFGARHPVRRLASIAMVRIIDKGDNISVYSRASGFQGWLSDSRKNDPLSFIGAAQCLGNLYRSYGHKITSGLVETSNIVVKLMKYPEVSVRIVALEMLQDALEGSAGAGPFAAYSEAFRTVMRFGVTDKSPAVRTVAAGCLRAFAITGGPGLGASGLENSASLCVKALEDPIPSVRDAFAEALGALVALGLNPESQVQPKGKGQPGLARTLEGGLQKHLILPFIKATGPRHKDLRVGLTMAWVSFLEGTHLRYQHSDTELQNFALQAMDMLHGNSVIDAQAQACVLYILRVGIVEQMSEPTQKEFMILLAKQLCLPDTSPSMLVVTLRTLSHLLTTLGEVSLDSKEILDNSLVETLSNSSLPVRVEAALTLRTLAEVDPSCVGGLISYGVTTLRALRETVAIEKGERLRPELDCLHGQAAMLASLVSASPRLPLGIPTRLPLAILEISKKLLLESSRNPVSAGVEKEAGWMLLAAVISSMSKDELEEQEFDILALWTIHFGGNIEHRLKQAEENLEAEVCGWSAAVEALTAFVKYYVVPNRTSKNEGILLQPVLGYLDGALSYILSLTMKPFQVPKQAMDLFTVRTLIAYQALPDPLAYRSDHSRLLGLCTAPFREASSCEESSILRQLLDHRDASLGPLTPGRDSFEDELRAFEGGSDGPLPCIWEDDLPIFPQHVPLGRLLVNHMLLCFGIIFAAQGSIGKLQLLDTVEQSIKTGKKQAWHIGNITNVCVGLLSGLKASLVSRAMKSEAEVLQRMQSVFQGILSEEGACIAQRRAAAEGLGLLARVGNDVFAARLTRSLIADATGATDSNYKESISLALGCIHRSAGGMSLSILIPMTVQSLCMMARDPKDSVHIWSLHGLCLTIEAGGLSCVPHVQTILSLVMDILLYEEHPGIELRQNIGRLVNAIVAVLGPELSPGSSFFSRCKSVIQEISSGEEPSVLLECVRFNQQLVLFAPQAVSVHSHVQTLRPTLSSRQPTLRQAAVSTLRHLAERDPVVMIDERIEEDLFSMLDMETDSMIGKIVRATIDRLLDAACPSFPSRWLQICRNVVLATSTKKSADNGSLESEKTHNHDSFGEDDEGMIVNSKKAEGSESISSRLHKVDKGDQLPRYRTRVFAAECLSRLPNAVGKEQNHFDLLQARKGKMIHGVQTSGDWLVLHLAELVALAYQISTGTFEKMRPLGVTLLSTIVDKFEKTEDPELPGHFLMEQYQAQLVSAVRTAVDASAGPILLDAGFQLATKILTSSIASGDRVVLERMFAMISRPLGDFESLYYPSFAEWVSCKVKIRLLAAHAAVKTYAYYCIKNGLSNTEYSALVPLFLKNSTFLGRCWIGLLQDHVFLHTHILSKRKYKPFLDGIQSAAISSVVHPYLSEIWPVILQAATLDAAPAKFEHEMAPVMYASGHVMVKLETRDFYLLWGLAMLILFEGRHEAKNEKLKQFSSSCTYSVNGKLAAEIPPPMSSQLVALYALQCLSNQGFYNQEMVSHKLCLELLQILMYPGYINSPQTITLVSSILEQVIEFSPDEYFMDESFVFTITELCMHCMHKLFGSDESNFPRYSDLIASSLQISERLICRLSSKMQTQVASTVFYASYGYVLLAPMGSSISMVAAFIGDIAAQLATQCTDESCLDENSRDQIEILLGSLVQTIAQDCEQHFEKLHRQETSEASKDLFEKLTLLLGIMINLTRSVLLVKISADEHNIKENIWSAVKKPCINCLRKTLVDSNVQVQMAGLHALRTILQTAVAENPKNNNYTVALIVMGDLASDVFSLIQNSTQLQKLMTNELASSVGESLKLFLLLYTLIEASESQQDVLNLLLQAIIMAVSLDSEENLQASTGLRSVAMKLVSHLANVPSSATQFRAVLQGMPVDIRQKLQDIIRASVAQETKSSLAISLPVPLTVPKLVVQSSAAKSEMPSQPDSIMSISPRVKSDDGLDGVEDDDWDNFQSFPVSTTVISEDTVQYESASGDLSKQGTDFPAEDWDDFQSFSETRSVIDSTIIRENIEDGHVNSLSGAFEEHLSQQKRTIQKENLQEDDLNKFSEDGSHEDDAES
ncbi:protein SWEETIE isoform X1 [Cryptomeria japonica]|uniref:protein SWEETIE isoform X1 n=1 Tax=Cryptomeria japonica TaxID=3369 RepID=UPI0027DA664A|nr:protein SWEETIE isoform X1 [Cryptomeria japonica]XP_057828165.2 protein SWEETIE isoform X1 [Cryptomeria japonica]